MLRLILYQVPRGFGLAFLSCFEELDKELCEPRIRAFMEQQVFLNFSSGENVSKIEGDKNCHWRD